MKSACSLWNVQGSWNRDPSENGTIKSHDDEPARREQNSVKNAEWAIERMKGKFRQRRNQENSERYGENDAQAQKAVGRIPAGEKDSTR